MSDIIQRLKDASAEKEYATILYTLLPELFKAADEGKIIELPCKAETIVFTIYGFYCPICKKNHERIEPRSFELSMLNDFGKTVFLTREAAEAALQEREK